MIICDEPVKEDKTEEHLETAEDVSNEDEGRETSPSPDLLTVSRRVTKLTSQKAQKSRKQTRLSVD